jgi:hypothetical protein
MGTSRDQFRKQIELRDSWNTICTSDQWKAVQVYAKGELMEQALSPDAHMGAMRMLHILNNLTSAEEDEFHWPSSGLRHMPEHPRPKSIFDEEVLKKAT